MKKIIILIIFAILPMIAFGGERIPITCEEVLGYETPPDPDARLKEDCSDKHGAILFKSTYLFTAPNALFEKRGAMVNHLFHGEVYEGRSDGSFLRPMYRAESKTKIIVAFADILNRQLLIIREHR